MVASMKRSAEVQAIHKYDGECRPFRISARTKSVCDKHCYAVLSLWIITLIIAMRIVASLL